MATLTAAQIEAQKKAKADLEAKQGKFKQSLIDRIYQEITKVIGGGDQLFCMLFPGQPLNKKQYEYDTSSYASVITKPWIVEESEFRLSDQLFDLSPIVQATNGERLSVVYESLLNNYLPKLNELAHYFKDRAGLAGFLTEDSGEVDENGNSLSRIELCKKLYKEYLVQKDAWEQEKRNKLLAVKEKTKNATQEERNAELDDYANWHSSVAVVRNAELDNLYNDVVVTGHFHEVLTILGFLNASSISEELEKTKQNLRHAQRLSLDESMDIFPVQFIPNNWAEALTPNLHPEDLTMAQDVLVGSLRAKRKELETLKEQLKELELLNVDPSQVEQLQSQVENAKKQFNDAEANVVAEFGRSAVDAVKIYLNATSGWTLGLMENIGKLAEKQEGLGEGTPTFDEKTVADLGLASAGKAAIAAQVNSMQEVADELVRVYNTEKETLLKAEKLTELQAQLAQAKSQNMTLQKERLREQINSVQDDIEYLGSMVSGVYAKNVEHRNTGLLQDRKLVTIATTQIGTPARTTPGVNARQTITLNATVTGGTFVLKFGSNLSSAINHNASASDIQTALAAAGLPSTDITVTGSSPTWTIEFQGSQAARSIQNLSVDPTTALTDVSGNTVVLATAITIATTQQGQAAGQTPATNAVQTITLNSSAKIDGGTFTLTFNNVTTEPLAHNIPNTDLQQKLIDSKLFASGDVTVSGSSPTWTLTFDGKYAAQVVPELTIDPTNIKFTSNAKPIPNTIDNRPSLNVLPEPKTITEADGLFSDIVISIKESEASSLTLESSEASNSSWNASVWFAHAQGQSGSASAVTSQESMAFSNAMDIGFRVAKVTFDRGGWFNPTIFKLAHNGDFYRLSEMRAGAGITKSQIDSWQEAGSKSVMENVSKGLEYSYVAQDGSTQKGKYLLPCYPVAMIIAKDITFKVEMDLDHGSQMNESMSDSSSYGGSFLSFNYSHAESSQSSTQSNFHGHQGQHYYIRIPGPQILGYTLQLLDKDNTELKPSFRDDDDKLTFIEALQEFDKFAATMFPKALAGNGRSSIVFNIVGLPNNTVVEATHPVGGRVDDPTVKQIWVITHVVGTSAFVVDSSTTPSANGEWSCNVSFGRRGTDAGKKFEVRAVADPVRSLHSDMILDDWPKGKLSTEIVTVQRDSTAS